MRVQLKKKDLAWPGESILFLFFDDVCYIGAPCQDFREWMLRMAPSGEADFRELWEAIDRPSWMSWFLCYPRIFGSEIDALGKVLEEGAPLHEGVIEDPVLCALFRLAFPADLLEALFEEHQRESAP